MIAVLFNSADVRLGWRRVGDDTKVIQFGGAIFARTGVEVILPDGSTGVAFDQCIIDVCQKLDVYKPTMGVRDGSKVHSH